MAGHHILRRRNITPNYAHLRRKHTMAGANVDNCPNVAPVLYSLKELTKNNSLRIAFGIFRRLWSFL